MKRAVLILVVLAVITTVSIYLWGRDQTAKFLAAPPTGNGPSHGVAVPIARASETSRPASSAIRLKGHAKGAHPFPGMALNRDRLALTDDPFAPTSKEEQRWLDRHGYPTQEQIDVYSTASEATLEQAISAGDKIAADFLESRRLAAGDLSAEKRLWEMAVDGQTYALTGLAGYYAQNGPKGDPMKAYAYSRVSEMRGDYKAALTRDFVVNRPLTPMQRIEAEGKALTIFRAMTELRRQRFGPNVPVADPRPLAVD